MNTESEIINFIDEINKASLKEWDSRFEIHIVDIRNNLVHILMSDKDRRVIRDDYLYWSEIFKGSNIWDAYNNFVNNQLKEETNANSSK